MPPGGCLTDEALNLFQRGELPPGEREEIKSHLSRCRACRRQLAHLYKESRAETGAHRAPRWLKARAFAIPENRPLPLRSLIYGFRRQVAGVAALLLVAVGAIVYLSIKSSQATLPPAEVLRQETQIMAAPRLLAPAADAIIAAEQVEFRWSANQGAEGYLFTLLDEKGDIVLQHSTQGDRLTVNVTATGLKRGGTYFWYVGAKSAVGTMVNSAVGKFVLSAT